LLESAILIWPVYASQMAYHVGPRNLFPELLEIVLPGEFQNLNVRAF